MTYLKPSMQLNAIKTESFEDNDILTPNRPSNTKAHGICHRNMTKVRMVSNKDTKNTFLRDRLQMLFICIRLKQIGRLVIKRLNTQYFEHKNQLRIHNSVRNTCSNTEKIFFWCRRISSVGQGFAFKTMTLFPTLSLHCLLRSNSNFVLFSYRSII